jgi:hypothetical protein
MDEHKHDFHFGKSELFLPRGLDHDLGCFARQAPQPVHTRRHSGAHEPGMMAAMFER